MGIRNFLVVHSLVVALSPSLGKLPGRAYLYKILDNYPRALGGPVT